MRFKMLKEIWLESFRKNFPEAVPITNFDNVPDEFHCESRIQLFCLKHSCCYTTRATTNKDVTSSCPSCNKEKQRLRTAQTFEEIRDRFLRYSNNQVTLERIENRFQKRKEKAVLSCSLHGEFSGFFNYYLRRIREGRLLCPFCSKVEFRKKSGQSYLTKAKKIHGDNLDFSLVNFKNANERVVVICRKHGKFKTTMSAVVDRGAGCKKCAYIGRRTTPEVFAEKARKIHGDKYDYSAVKCSFVVDNVDIICRKHGSFTQTVHAHLRGSGCPSCAKENKFKGLDVFLKEAREIHGDKYDYRLVKKLGKRKKIKVKVICPVHGVFKVTPFSHIVGHSGCPRCNESYGERRVSMFLEKYGIKYIREYKLDGYKYRYDFFLPDFNIFIEFHGKQHYVPVNTFGGFENLKRTRERDAIKISLAAQNNIGLIVINYDSLRCKDIDRSFVGRLKRHGLYWTETSDGFKIFKNVITLANYYEIKENFPIKNVESLIRERFDSKFRILF